jgi:hypothetical protein
LAGLSAVVLGQGEVARARTLLAESLALYEAVGDTAGLLDGLEGVAALAAAAAQVEDAVRLAGAAAGLRATLGVMAAPAPRRPAGPTDLLEQGRRVLGAAASDRAWAEGAQLSLAHALGVARLVIGADGAPTLEARQ